MRKRRLLINTITSLTLQVVTVICGFILPRVILDAYGSEINGLVNSISQFLHVITFLELGVGAVVQSSLYKPLAENDTEKISEVLTSANKFFQKLGLILLVYVIALMGVYPFIAQQDFGHFYSAMLIGAVSISQFAQYYFGIVNGILLNADQKGYIQYTAAIITLVLTTIVCCVEIKLGYSIHVVKLSSSIIYLIRPLVLKLYVSNHYQVNWKAKYEAEPIKQKWNGIAQHISTVVLDGTDSIVLTVFSTLTNVSIYSVYNLVTYGVKNLFFSITNGGIQSLLGELWAKNEKENLRFVFSWIEWLIHNAATLLFTCTGILIIPFIEVYTKGISDTNYIQPLFAILLVAANGVHCLRLPYHIMIKAAGRYKETQNSYFISATINIVLSVLMVKSFGLVGVAIGTLVSMLYQTFWMAWYNARFLQKTSFIIFVKLLCCDLTCSLVSIGFCWAFRMKSITYFSWVLHALIVATISIAVMIIVNMIFYRSMMMRVIVKIKKHHLK